MQTPTQKMRQRTASGIAGMAMQIDFPLDHPAAASEIAQDLHGNSPVQVGGLVTAFQTVGKLNGGMNQIMQHCLLVEQVLTCHWLGRLGA
jgi:hypothetical protein